MKKVNAKPAATIMLARDYEDELQVLLLKRNKALAFAGGVWVFPGGKIEVPEFEKTANDLEAAKLAAVRETKEETNLDVDPTQLIFYRHWTTPAAEPRRFATWFFFNTVQTADSSVQIDDGEIKQYQWINPQKALEHFRMGQLYMFPPTFISLQLIRKCNTTAEASKLLHQEDPIHILPVIAMNGQTITIMYDGDAGYSSSNPELPGARHRMILDPAQKTTRFEYQNCKDFPAVNSGDDFFG